MTRKDLLGLALAATLLLLAEQAQAAPAQHKAPSTCNIVVTKNGKNTLTEVWVGHINDGDSLTVSYTYFGAKKTTVLGKGTTYLGTNVTDARVNDAKDKKVC